MASRKPLVLGIGSAQELAGSDTLAVAALTVSTSFIYGTSGATADTNAFINGGPATNRSLIFETNGSPRWAFNLDSSVEGAGNSGGNFGFARFDNNAVFLDIPFTINRATGTTTITLASILAGTGAFSSLTAATPAVGDNSTKVATMASVWNATKGNAAIATTGGSATLTPAQYGANVLLVSGALTSAAILTVPVNGEWTVYNGTTGAFTLTVKTPSGTGVPITQGQRNQIYSDSTNVQYSTPSGANALLQWTGGTVVTNGTYYFTLFAPFAGTISALDYITAAGTFTVNVQIAGVSVTGLSAVAVSGATQASATATAANVFAAGQVITVVITAAASSPTGSVLSLRLVRG